MSTQTETHPHAAEMRTGIMPIRFLLAALAYIIPTFPLGYFWHLTIFRHTYATLAVYRLDIMIPLGVCVDADPGRHVGLSLLATVQA